MIQWTKLCQIYCQDPNSSIRHKKKEIHSMDMNAFLFLLVTHSWSRVLTFRTVNGLELERKHINWNWRSFYSLSSTRDWYGNCWCRLFIKKKLHYRNHIPWGPAWKRAKGNLHYINQGLLKCVAQLGNNLIDISFQNNPKTSYLTSVVTQNVYWCG